MPVVALPDQRPGLHDLAPFGASRIADVEHVDRRRLRRIGAAESRDGVEPIVRHVSAANAVGIAEAVRQVARIDLVDFDHAIVARLVRDSRRPDSRAGSRRWRLPVGVAGRRCVYWNTPTWVTNSVRSSGDSAMPNG